MVWSWNKTIAIPLLYYSVDVKSNMALFQFRKVLRRPLHLLIWRRLQYEMRSWWAPMNETKGVYPIANSRQSLPLSIMLEFWKRAAEHAVVATKNTNCACSRQKWLWLTGIINPWNLILPFDVANCCADCVWSLERPLIARADISWGN